VALVAGVGNQAHWYTHRLGNPDLQTDIAEVLRLHDRIEQCCAEHAWVHPVISVTSCRDYLHHQVANVLMYERHRSRRQTLGLIGQGVVGMPAREALDLTARSDLVVLTCPRRPAFPLEKSMAEHYPRLLRLCREQFTEVESFRLFDDDVTLFCRPALRLAAHPHAWVAEEGFRLEGPAAALHSCRALVLHGPGDFSRLRVGHMPAVHAELHVAGHPPQPLPAGLEKEEGKFVYRLLIDCTSVTNVYGGPVELRLTFDTPPPVPDEPDEPGPTRPFLRVPGEIETFR
jgi:hypothetical protein